MGILSALCILLMLTGAVDSATQAALTGGQKFFDCRRSGQECTTDSVGGATATCGKDANNDYVCTCTTGIQALLSGPCIDDAKVAACDVPATVHCENGGVCKKISGTDKCICPPGWTGTTCDTPSVKVTCDDTAAGGAGTMVVEVPGIHSGFNGKIFGKDDRSCTFTVSAGADPIVTPKTIPYGTCGMTGHTDEIDGAKQPQLVLIIQYNSNFLTAADQTVTVKCTNPATGNLRPGEAMIGQADLANNLGVGGTDLQSFPLVMTLQKVSGGTGTDVATNEKITIGDDMQINFAFTAGATYKAYKVHDCEIKNAFNAQKVVLVESTGCPGTNAAGVVRGSHTGGGAGPAQIPFYAFMFLPDTGSGNVESRLIVTCQIKLCNTAENTNGDCTVTCPTGVTGVGRRKRAAVNNDETLIQTFTVTTAISNKTVAGTIESGIGSGQFGEASRCLGNPQMQTVLAVLGLVLVLAVVALASVAFLYCRARNQQNEHVKYVDNYAMGSSTQTLHGPKV